MFTSTLGPCKEDKYAPKSVRQPLLSYTKKTYPDIFAIESLSGEIGHLSYLDSEVPDATY